jgi:hypothetical protein
MRSAIAARLLPVGIAVCVVSSCSSGYSVPSANSDMSHLATSSFFSAHPPATRPGSERHANRKCWNDFDPVRHQSDPPNINVTYHLMNGGPARDAFLAFVRSHAAADHWHFQRRREMFAGAAVIEEIYEQKYQGHRYQLVAMVDDHRTGNIGIYPLATLCKNQMPPA